MLRAFCVVVLVLSAPAVAKPGAKPAEAAWLDAALTPVTRSRSCCDA
jgi:hypothetical protein